MITTFQARGRFQAEPTDFTCTVDSSRIVIAADPSKVLSLARAVSAGLGGREFTPANVSSTLNTSVFDLGCRPEITGWLKRVI